ncbi:MAG: hypothetical protein DME33_07755 [Verrucomicrobia bacterium]|nr:MAG: hypothetical protein DME33_07755 [Verrucomicrobiota bacterium]
MREAADSETSSEHALAALSELCQIYWRPIYLFLRRQGYAFDDAEDLTQGFFAHLIQNRGYARADPEMGRFRAFLLGALKYFIAGVRKRESAQKRGGALSERCVSSAQALARPTRITADIRIDASTNSSLRFRSCFCVLLNASRVNTTAFRGSSVNREAKL